MRYLVALFFPWISFFTMGKVGQGFLCLLLQCTLVGWLPATIWAFVTIGSYKPTSVLGVSKRRSPPVALSERCASPSCTGRNIRGLAGAGRRYYVDCEVLFSEEEKAIIKARDLSRHHLTIDPPVPPPVACTTPPPS